MIPKDQKVKISAFTAATQATPATVDINIFLWYDLPEAKDALKGEICSLILIQIVHWQ